VAMNLDDTAVDHGVFEIRIFCQGSEHMVKCVGFHPSADALEHRVPLAELRRKVAPWTAGSRDPEHRLDEHPRRGALLPVFNSAIGDLRDFALVLACFVLLMAWKAPPWVVVIVAAVGGIGLTLIA